MLNDKHRSVLTLSLSQHTDGSHDLKAMRDWGGGVHDIDFPQCEKVSKPLPFSLSQRESVQQRSVSHARRSAGETPQKRTMFLLK